MPIVFKAKAEKKISKKLVEPQKSFETKTFKKYFFLFFFCFSFINDRRTNVVMST